MFDLNRLIRDNIRALVPYSSARDEFSGTATIFLDANENSLGSPIPEQYNRYPDPHQAKIKELLSGIKGIPVENIFLGNGSDECIDLLYRAFCIPGKDNVIINPPTYGMYEVSAHINDVEVRKAMLSADFQPDLESMESLVDENTKMIWLCSPNNPTGNAFHHESVEMILNNFDGLVIIDEAYINFSRYRGFTQELTEYPNLVVLQTLSKAWGLAGLRVGMAFAGRDIVEVLNRIKPPYNISQPAQDLVMRALQETARVNEEIREIVGLREWLADELGRLPQVRKVYPSEANFLLVKIDRAREVYERLLKQGIVLRDRSRVALCEDCLRITIGKKEENEALLRSLETA
jgi:histidinol-phosphate aminotransferase